MTDRLRLVLARAIYIAMYGDQGGDWNAVETKDVWLKKADIVLRLMPDDSFLASARAEHSVCAEILAIMEIYDQQEASPHGVDTPGGLEHMGDVWRLFQEWRDRLNKSA